ncbi:IS110 family transposase [Pseudonocardia halophobica]|uniref:IS110 family transposase n=1 Tax=Pseudonocardia halophobica TaxID=29401 RepID=UPI003D8FF64E
MSITCGIDWAEAHHDVAVSDEHGRILARRRIGADLGLQRAPRAARRALRRTGHCPGRDRDGKNLLVTALQHAGFDVYASNPRAGPVTGYATGRPGRSPTQATQPCLAGILRTDRHLHRPLPQIIEEALGIKAAARQHQEAIWALHQTISRLRAVLLEFYPQALVAFPKLKHHAAMAALAAAPTPDAGMRLSKRKIISLLRGCGRRNDPVLVDQIHRDLRTAALRQPEPVEAALGVTVSGLIEIITAMLRTVAALEKHLTSTFAEHSLAPVLPSAPGLGPILASRVLAEIGDDPERFSSANGLCAFAGTAPGDPSRSLPLCQGT